MTNDLLQTVRADSSPHALSQQPHGLPQQAIAISSSRPISRDEMNLAEFPLTVLSTRSNPKLKTLEFSDSIKGKNGEIIDRSWIITGADKFGLPTSSDDEVLLGLLKLTVDDTFRDRKVFFTRYELLRILRWTTEGRSYERLQKALDRLSGVRIKATNAFYDNESKSHSTRNFGILDAYEINDGRSTAPKPSFFTWSDVLFKSFQVGFIKKLDLDFYLGLQSAVTKRLYRYLDKHFWYKSKVQVNLFVLAHEKVGISRNYGYASSLRQQLDPAIEELIRSGFLKGAEYVGKGRDTEVSLFAATGKPRSTISPSDQQVLSAVQKRPPESAAVRCEGPAELPDLIEQLVVRGIREAQARRLLEAKSAEQCERVREIIAYFDQLCSSPAGRKMKSPVGFLYRAVEKPEAFVIPGQENRVARQEALALKPAAADKKKAAQRAQSDLESLYLVERKRQVQRLKEDIEPAILRKLGNEVEQGLLKLKGLISPERFSEAILHGVEEKILKLFAFPSFEEWLKRR